MLPRVRLADTPPSTLLDPDFCLSQDWRRFVCDGLSSRRLICVDLHPEFNEQRYELFRDRMHFSAKFITAGMLDDSPQNPELTWQHYPQARHPHVVGYEEYRFACARAAEIP